MPRSLPPIGMYAVQVCELTALRRLVLSTEQGSWGGEHARRRAADLQARSCCIEALVFLVTAICVHAQCEHVCRYVLAQGKEPGHKARSRVTVCYVIREHAAGTGQQDKRCFLHAIGRRCRTT